MKRVKIDPRPDFQQTLEQMGFSWHTHAGGAAYWDETAYWSISQTEAAALQTAGREAYEMLLDTIEYVITTGQLALFGYDDEAQQLIKKSWDESDSEPTLYGRFDFAYDGSQPKILEFQGDNPGTLFETAMVQRQWAQNRFPNNQQFNVLHEEMLNIFSVLHQFNGGRSSSGLDWNPVLHITGVAGEAEAEGTAAYLANCAEQAGVHVKLLSLQEIGFQQDNDGSGTGFFVDLEDEPIRQLLKLRPLNWMIEDTSDFGSALKRALLNGNIRAIEPPWKMLASHKRILAVMWDRYAYHPLLLQASMSPLTGVDQVRKPVTGQEGQNITMLSATGQEIERTGGAYANDVSLYQERATLISADGNNAVCGVWIVGGDGAALGIRESDHLITDNNSRFVPHIIE